MSARSAWCSGNLHGRALLGVLLLPAFILAAATPQSTTNVPDVSSYSQADPMINHSMERLREEIPELKKLEPSTDQSSLPLILRRVGDNLDLFMENFVNTTSLEDIDESSYGAGAIQHTDAPRGLTGGERAVSYGHNSIHQRFRYLMLVRPGTEGRLEEYRTDLQGQDRSTDRPVAGFLKTAGFASLPLLLDHHRQDLSDFRYLGTQVLNDRRTHVVAFAGHPVPTAVVVFFKLYSGESIPVILQGIAWIDAENYQILRLRTDLLAPQTATGLRQETTVVLLQPVTFRQSPAALWLPLEVQVTAQFRGMLFQNRHRYSHYELFRVETEQKVQSPQPDSKAPPR
jgi:hypothetical protein